MSHLINKPLINDVTIEITNLCQLHCQHCGIWAEEDRYEMSASLVIRLIKELLEKYRIYFISITGGEPFLHKNCGRILKALAFFRERRIITGFGVYCNAAYFEGVKKVLSVYGQYLQGMSLGISIDGSPKTHDRLRGAGAYQKTLKTIQWIVENFGQEIVLEFKFTINRINYSELREVYQLARYFNAKFSPKIMESGVVDYYHRHDMPESKVLSALTQDMIEEVIKQVKNMLNDNYQGVDRELVEAMLVLLVGGKQCIQACATPSKSLFITSRREVYPCLYLSSAGKVSLDGRLPEVLDKVRKEHADNAAQGDCPRCLAYHGFLHKFNLKYLEQ